MKNAITIALAALLFAARATGAEPTTQAQPSVAAAAEKARQLISAADFGALPFMIRPKLSPDAQRVASEAYIKGNRSLAILKLFPKTAATHTFAIPPKWDLLWYRWAGNDRVLISVGRSDLLFGDEVYVSRLVTVSIASPR
jgi:hypothetical protein